MLESEREGEVEPRFYEEIEGEWQFYFGRVESL